MYLIEGTTDYFIDDEFNIYRGERVLKITLLSIGYYVISINRKCVYLHRVIAQMFIPNPDNKPMVNHKNGVKTDNRIENLEWVTAKENIDHAYQIGLKIRCRGSQISKTGYTDSDIKKMISLRKNGTPYKELHSIYPKLSMSRIYAICLGYGWNHVHATLA